MANSDVLVRMKADTTGYNANIAKARRTLEGFKNDNLTLGGILAQTTKNLAGAAAGFASLAAATGAIKELVSESVKLAKESEGVRLAFERLNNPGLLDKLNEATHNTVSNMELMKAAVKFNDFRLPVEQLGTMLAFAQQKAKDTGQSIDYMVESITNGLGRQSKPILDNLGISAKEIEERMKSTGDFTKAVAEIIRDQMAKSGDYIETAADRAAQADKRLKDSMEELGRTFQPLADSASSMWNDIKIGAIDLLNNAVRPLIDALTEAGRIRAKYANQGGDARVNRQLGRLGNIHSMQYRRNTYNAQLANYDSKIGSYEQYLSDYKKWQGDKTAVGAYDRMQAFQKQTGLSMYSDVEEQLGVFKKMRYEYVMGAKSIIEDNPAPSPTATTSGKTGGSKKGTPDIADWNKAFKNGMSNPDELKRVIDVMSPFAMMTEEAKRQMLGLSEVTRDFGGAMADIGNQDVLTQIAGYTKRIDQQRKATELAAQATANLGSALSSIEDPGLRAAGTVMSAIANIALGFSQAAIQAEALGPYGWIAYMAAGTAAMAATISAIHSATGYAQGGIVEGKSYSGDNIPAMLNAGEIVLSKSMQSTLAANLTSQDRGLNIVGELQGEKIVLVANRYFKRTGQGEIVTW